MPTLLSATAMMCGAALVAQHVDNVLLAGPAVVYEPDLQDYLSTRHHSGALNLLKAAAPRTA